MKNILITGPPRCGKSTFIETLVHQIQKPVTGFYTREIREKGIRKGFSIITLHGRQGVLAHEKLKSRYRVGKYGVHLSDIDRIAVPSMIPSQAADVIVIDEVGKMECLSLLFKKALTEALDSSNPVIGSISLKGSKFIQAIKNREDILLIHINEKNRDDPALFSQLLSILK